MIQPIFRLNILEGFIHTFHENSQHLVARLNNEADMSAINITVPVNQCVLNILHGEEHGMCSAATNFRGNSQITTQKVTSAETARKKYFARFEVITAVPPVM
jgi:ABC-type sulfate transport system permease subunit